ncbi:MAG: hypothetical protein V4604_06770 [Bacteroidota bacterium]
MIQKPVWPIQRILVLATIALIFAGFFEKRRPQFQPNKKAITEQVAECDADEDTDDELIGGGSYYLALEKQPAENTFISTESAQKTASVCGKKGKTLPKWMMYQQLKIDGPAV